MASSDYIENAIASNVEESAVSELASSLENSISNPGVVGHPPGGPPGRDIRFFLIYVQSTSACGPVTGVVLCCTFPGVE
jgi:hypothetical protein